MRLSFVACRKDCNISILNKPGQKRSMHHAFRDPAETVDNGLNRDPGCHLTRVLSTYAIRNSEKPPLRLDLRRCRREHVTDEIFVVLAGKASIRKLRKLKVKHGCPLVTARPLSSEPLSYHKI